MPQPRPIAFLDARLIDPDRLAESRGGALVVDGKIAALGPMVRRDAIPPEARIVECDGDVVAPGLIDMLAFIGEPGAEHRETIASASAAAAAGGVTTLVARPDTNPPVDDPAVVDAIQTAGPNRWRVRDQVCNLDYYKGVTGWMQFDGTSTNIAPVRLVRIDHGRRVFEPEPEFTPAIAQRF